jgi:LPXTG-site transpeptidase (sortase) family protein
MAQTSPSYEPNKTPDGNPAADVIRQKLKSIYADEPGAAQEEAEAAAAGRHRSKHQKFMYELQSSGKSLATIQTAWHNYYVKLADAEKHQVWQEFYAANEHLAHHPRLHQPADGQSPQVTKLPDGGVVVEHQPLPMAVDRRKPSRIKERLKSEISERAQGEVKKHGIFRSLGFGLAMGTLVILVFLFSFFNQVIIAPFIQPSRHVSATPLILGSSTVAATATPEVIIPKINVEIPVDYSQTTDDENVIENALQSGVVHYPSTVLPGQNGNTAFFGHSSNNIFNPGKYKFAFVLLHTLVKGDTFYLTYNGTVYIYQVIDTKVVSPNDVAVLNDTEGHQATATLITCDPPGTSINRLVVTGVQISPNPGGNTTAAAPAQAVSQPSALASNGPSLWARFWHWLT